MCFSISLISKPDKGTQATITEKKHKGPSLFLQHENMANKPKKNDRETVENRIQEHINNHRSAWSSWLPPKNAGTV